MKVRRKWKYDVEEFSLFNLVILLCLSKLTFSCMWIKWLLKFRLLLMNIIWHCYYLSCLALEPLSWGFLSFQWKGLISFPVLVFTVPAQQVIGGGSNLLTVLDSGLWYPFISCSLIVISEYFRNIILGLPCCFFVVFPFYFIFEFSIDFFLLQSFLNNKNIIMFKFRCSFFCGQGFFWGSCW